SLPAEAERPRFRNGQECGDECTSACWCEIRPECGPQRVLPIDQFRTGSWAVPCETVQPERNCRDTPGSDCVRRVASAGCALFTDHFEHDLRQDGFPTAATRSALQLQIHP